VPVKALLWMVVPVLGLAELGAHYFFSTRAPGLEAWRDLAPHVERLHEPGDLVVVAPDWAEPNARHALGDALMPFEHVARADVTPFRRALEVGLRGARAAETAAWRVQTEERVGPFRLRVLENPAPEAVVFDFTGAVADADVRVLTGDREEACLWRTHARRSAGGLHGHPAFPAERHVCPGAEHHFVGVTAVEDEQWRGRRCLWAHAVDGKALAIRFADVPLGARIRGYGTLPWWLERELKGETVGLEVLVGGAPIGRYEHRDGSPWEPFSFETGRAGQRGDVEFRITSPRARDRQFCFVADTR
jgi:hypothetical protein